MSIVLEVLDWNSQAIEATLDGSLFYIVLDWNDSFQSWSMAIRNAAYRTLLDGVSLVPNYPLTWQFRYEEMPKGELSVATADWTDGPIPRDGFSSGKYELIYTSEQELIDSDLIDAWGRTYPLAI